MKNLILAAIVLLCSCAYCAPEYAVLRLSGIKNLGECSDSGDDCAYCRYNLTGSPNRTLFIKRNFNYTNSWVWESNPDCCRRANIISNRWPVFWYGECQPITEVASGIYAGVCFDGYGMSVWANSQSDANNGAAAYFYGSIIGGNPPYCYVSNEYKQCVCAASMPPWIPCTGGSCKVKAIGTVGGQSASKINLKLFSEFAKYWGTDNAIWDLDENGAVDYDDLAVICESWLY